MIIILYFMHLLPLLVLGMLRQILELNNNL